MKKKKVSSIKISLALIATTLIWGTNYVPTKIAVTEIAPIHLAALRFAIVGFILLVVLRFFKPETRIKKEDIILLFTLGFVGITLQQIFFLYGMKHTLPTHSALMGTLTPIFVFLLAVVMINEKITILKISGIITSFIGVFIILHSKGLKLDNRFLFGDLLSLASAFVFAVYVVLSKPFLLKYGSLSTTAYTTFIGGMLFIPFLLFDKTGFDWTTVSTKVWMSFAYLTVFASVFALSLWYWVLTYIDTTKAAVTMYFQPVIAAIFSYLIYSEEISKNLIFGGIFILLGIFITEKG
ncbi:MAG: DMT family transporter [Candidatus Firestonebacteria bacterium]